MLRLGLLFLFFTQWAYGLGYFVNQAEADLRVYHHYFDEDYIESYITKNMAGKEPLLTKESKAKEIAFLMKNIGKHFQVDPILFLSLIRMESAFFYTNNLSQSGAVGLTQFVQSGLKEVFDQFGVGSNPNTSKESQKYFEKAYEGMREEIKDRYSYIPFKELKEKLSEFNLYKSSGLLGFKKIFKENLPIQIIFGATFLKTLVARQCDKEDKEYCINKNPYRDSEFKKKLLGFYRKSLIGYNGEKTPITICTHNGRADGVKLPVEQNFMRFCYASRISYWAKQIDSALDKNFQGLKKKLNHIHFPKLNSSFLILNNFIAEEQYHKRVFDRKLVGYTQKRELCDQREEDLQYFILSEKVDERKSIYSQEREYYVPYCEQERNSRLLKIETVKIKIEFSIDSKHVSKISLTNPQGPFRYQMEPRENLDHHLSPAIEEFVESDFIYDFEHTNLENYYTQGSFGSSDAKRLSLYSDLMAISSKRNELSYFKAEFIYDTEKSKFLEFKCKINRD